MTAAWISVIGSAVTAIAAFGGVVLAQRGTRARDLEGRIWECRSRAYEELMRWILATTHAIEDLMPSGEASQQRLQLSDDQARALLPAPDLEARVTAYASWEILRDFRNCRRVLASPAGRRDTAQVTAWAVRSLGDDIRAELRTGREQQEPLVFHLQHEWTVLRSTLFPAFGRRHASHSRGHLEQEEDGTAFTWQSDPHGAADAPRGEPRP